MTDKKLLRPANPLPNFANDALLADPGKPWDATATKVEPGAGKRDDGWLPEERPGAQHHNQLHNEIGLWLQFMSDMQVLNWFGNTIPEEPATTANTAEAMVYDEGSHEWVTGGRADIVQKSSDGVLWTEHVGGSGTGGTLTWAATKNPLDSPVHTFGRSLVGCGGPLFNAVVAEYNGTSFATQTLPGTGGTIQSEWGIFDPFNSLWIVVGADNGAPAIWTDATPVTGFTSETVTASGSTSIEMVATNPNTGLSVAIGNTIFPFDVWTSPDGTTWTRSTPTGVIAGDFADSIAYDNDLDVFVITSNAAVYTSPGNDGTAWTAVFTNGVVSAFQKRCLLVIGSMYIASSQFATGITKTGIRYSSDGGVIWREVAIGIGDGSTSAPIDGLAYSQSRGQIMASWEDNPNSGRITLSLALGTSRMAPDGTVQTFLGAPQI